MVIGRSMLELTKFSVLSNFCARWTRPLPCSGAIVLHPYVLLCACRYGRLLFGSSLLGSCDVNPCCAWRWRREGFQIWLPHGHAWELLSTSLSRTGQRCVYLLAWAAQLLRMRFALRIEGKAIASAQSIKLRSIRNTSAATVCHKKSYKHNKECPLLWLSVWGTLRVEYCWRVRSEHRRGYDVVDIISCKLPIQSCALHLCC